MSDYKALYRKWRPRDFDGVMGQDGITDILKYEVANNKLSHAYLFCGSRGTGKTSCAKILAKAVNCEHPQNGNPCNRCEACRSIDSGIATDVIEMDAASNNGINDVRDMQDEIAFTPALLKYRVYIIDEVHMMSGAAFNALLKTLEEPPTYVIFILATTEYNKLPTTIVSRCQRFDFKRISSEIIISRLLAISESEGIEITEDGARVIARVARGGMRDAISLLELCAGARQKIDEELVFSVVGSGNRESAYKIIDAISRSDHSKIYSVIDDIVMKSGDLSVFWQEIIDAYRDLLVVKNSDVAKSYLDLTDVEYSALKILASRFSPAKLFYDTTVLEETMGDMQRAFNSKRSIAEIALTRMCDPRLATSSEALLVRIEALEREVERLKIMPSQVISSKASVQTVDDFSKSTGAVFSRDEKNSSYASDKAAHTSTPDNSASAETYTIYSGWGRVLEKMRGVKAPLAAKLASASVEKSGNNFKIKIQDIFAKMLSSSETDVGILKSLIAQNESIPVNEVRLAVISSDKPSEQPFFSEIEGALN